MESQETLAAVKQLLAPQILSHIEELVFTYSWDGKRYREMALETGYEEGYLKDTGSRLWKLLSEHMDRQVTKKQLRLILKDTLQPSNSVTQTLPGKLEFPGFPLPFGSSLYIHRPPIEDLTIAALYQPGSLVRIKGSRQMGKTSLMNLAMEVAQQAGMRTAFVDIRQADVDVLEDPDCFLRWFCWTIDQQLNLDCDFDHHWFDSAGSKLSCTTYMQEHFLCNSNLSLVVAIDTVHHLVGHLPIASEFFSMLRSWYEMARVRSDWQKLRFLMTYGTEVELPLQAHQSPFNVGLPLDLPYFTESQVAELAKCYDLATVDIDGTFSPQPLLDLVGGHPYLIQLAFYWLQTGRCNFAQLLQDAATNQGIYQEHLRHLLSDLQQDDVLMHSFYQVVSSAAPVRLPSQIAFCLEGKGLVTLQNGQALPSCELYRKYFLTHLDDALCQDQHD